MRHTVCAIDGQEAMSINRCTSDVCRSMSFPAREEIDALQAPTRLLQSSTSLVLSHHVPAL